MEAKAGGQVLSLSDGFCVDRHRRAELEWLDVFANEVEIKALYQTDDVEIVDPLRVPAVTAITRGAQGSVVLSGDQHHGIVGLGPRGHHWRRSKVGSQAYTDGSSLERCGELGALCAGQIVTQLGARSQVPLNELAAKHLS